MDDIDPAFNPAPKIHPASQAISSSAEPHSHPAPNLSNCL